MNNSYVIQWKSTVNGRVGRGTKRFDKEEVDRVVDELNLEFPEIEHEAIPAATEAAATAEPAVPDSSKMIFSPA